MEQKQWMVSHEGEDILLVGDVDVAKRLATHGHDVREVTQEELDLGVVKETDEVEKIMARSEGLMAGATFALKETEYPRKSICIPCGKVFHPFMGTRGFSGLVVMMDDGYAHPVCAACLSEILRESRGVANE